MALNHYPPEDSFEHVYKNLEDDGHERVKIYHNEVVMDHNEEYVEFPDNYQTADVRDHGDEYLEGPGIYQNADVREHSDEYLEGPDIHVLDGFHDLKNIEESFRNRVDTDGVYNTSAGQINAILKGNVQ